MAMRDYEEMKHIVIPKEQEEMMDIISDAWEECHSLEACEECKDRPEKFMRMAMCTALKYTRKLIEAGYTKQPTADVQEVKHAKFEMVSGGKGVCSNCHRLDPIDELAKYCRYCGAKID